MSRLFIVSVQKFKEPEDEVKYKVSVYRALLSQIGHAIALRVVEHFAVTQMNHFRINTVDGVEGVC